MNLGLTLSLNPNQTFLLNSFLRQSRCVQLGSTIRVNHGRRFRLHWNLIHPMRNVTLFNQRHARNFWVGCSYKGNFCQKCVAVCTYSATPFFSANRTPIVMLLWKIIFLGSLTGFRSAGKILACLFPFLSFLLNLCLSLNTDISLSKIGESKSSACSLMYSGRKSVTKEGSFPPIFERTELPSRLTRSHQSGKDIFIL